jgi:hypothetical protein
MANDGRQQGLRQIGREAEQYARHQMEGGSSVKCRMVRQQLQSGLGISSLKSVDTYRSDGEPDRASEFSIFFPTLDSVDPIRSDRLALNEDRV